MTADGRPPLLLADHVVFTCQKSGACCRNDWLIGVDQASYERLRDVRWEHHDPALGAGAKFARLPFPLPGGEQMTFARQPGGACVFLTAGATCAIHDRLGAGAKPRVCREFPYTFADTPDGIAVGVSFACTAVRAHRGEPLAAQRDEIRAVLAGSTRVRRVPETIVLFSSVDIGWDEYRPIETALLGILAHDECSLPVALVAGSALLSLCVGLTQVEARARLEGRPPTQTLTGGLAQLREDRYRPVLAAARHARPPARPSLTHLAPLYTWLEFSRRRMSRFRLVAALYRNYFRFRRGAGRLPDLVTDDGWIDLQAVQRVRFDAERPEIDTFLREYWSHVIFRKTLVPIHGVFRGYQTMLSLYAFMKWAARRAAAGRGRGEVTLADVQDAVRLVEQRFVLHARFAEVFALSPVLTVMADRLFQQPAFVRAAVLEPAGPAGPGGPGRAA